jgi:DNA modification methylase
MLCVDEFRNKVLEGDSYTILKQFPSSCIDLVVTSPPYFNLRDYHHKEQVGAESTPQDYIKNLIRIFRECKRVLKSTGSIWVNIADSYASGGGKRNENSFVRNNENRKDQVISLDYPAKAKLRSTMGKSLLGIPERFCLAMQDDLGLIRRNTIIWHKPSCMPSSTKDRFTVDFEYFYWFVKNADSYYFETQYEPMKTDVLAELNRVKEYKGKAQKDYSNNKVQDPSDIKRRMIENWNKKIKFGGNKYPNAIGGAYTGNIWIPNENLERLKRTVWSINTGNSIENHFASYPEELIEIPIKACTKQEVDNISLVLDPFNGSGTTCVKSQKLKRSFVGIDINPEYVKIANRRLNNMITSYLSKNNG